MNYQKLFHFYTIIISSLSISLYVQSSAPTQQPRIPLHYKKMNYPTPLSASFLAAFNGTMSSWDNAAIQQAAQERHPDSGDTIAHLACNTETLAKIITVAPELLLTQNNDDYNPIHQFVRRHHETSLLITALNVLGQTPGHIDRAINQQRTKFGDTAAHVAVAAGQYRNLRLLCQYGANLSLRNRNRETPPETALRLLKSCQQNTAILHNALRKPFSPITTTTTRFPQQKTTTPASIAAQTANLTTDPTPQISFNLRKLKKVLSRSVDFPWLNSTTYPLCKIDDASEYPK